MQAPLITGSVSSANVSFSPMLVSPHTLATHIPWQPNRRRLPGRTADDDGDDDEEEEEGD